MNKPSPNPPPRPQAPPRWADRLLSWLTPAELLEELQGDLQEQFAQRVDQVGPGRARWWYSLEALKVIRPYYLRRRIARLARRVTSFFTKQPENYHPIFTPEHQSPSLINPAMLRSYLKIAIRNLAKNRVYSFINIGGLAMGMAVAVLIGLWVYDELSFNKQFKNYERIMEVRHLETEPSTGITRGSQSCPIPLGTALKNRYRPYFRHILIGFWEGPYTLMAGDKKLTSQGKFIEGGVIDMLSLTMLKGTQAALTDPHAIILAQSTAQALFGQEEPLGKLVKIDNRMDVTVTGVYEDLPQNASFGDLKFFAPWALYVSSTEGVKRSETSWENSSFSILVQLADNISLQTAKAALTDFYGKNLPQELIQQVKDYKTELFLYPMPQWHLYSEFKDGRPAAGRIIFVWLFGLVGGFVLLLACINFMNLSTARSEKRAKEVGIRKAVGSRKSQLVYQFLSESFLTVCLAFLLALLLVNVSLPLFNALANKTIVFPLGNPYFWGACLVFMGSTALLAGIYPAFYLSSFQPIKTLKGTLRVGNGAALPRRVLVVVQFMVSVMLIIGVFVVYKQIQHAKNRPVGYNQEGLVSISINDPAYKGQEEAIQRELLTTGMVARTAFSSTPLTSVWYNMGGFTWKNKDPRTESDFSSTRVSYDFGALAGWKILAGRDFSRAFSSDSTAVILNETAANYLHLKNRNGGTPIGEYMTMDDGKRKLQIIGVVKDMVMRSPYEPVKRGLYLLDPTYSDASRLIVRLNPGVRPQEALPQLEAVLKKMVPSAFFKYSFVDEDFAAKFAAEQRVGRLAAVFTILAILISCLGLFGLASFMAEQRTKEIGIRKALGASILNLWGLLSKDFLGLVLIAFGLATPIAWYLLTNWLQGYQYRTELSWWIFALAGLGATAISLLTVSYQSIKAALMNPVKSLRSE